MKPKMSKQQFINIALAVATAVAMVLGGLGYLADDNAPTARGTSNFDVLAAEDLTLSDDLTVTDDATISGDLTVSGAATVTGNATVSTDLTVDDTFNIDDTAYALTGAQTLTPTASYYALAPAATLTVTLATGSATDGDILILYNTVTTSTIVVDTTATVGGGNITLGQNDLAVFLFANSVWAEVASPDNS